MPGARVVELLAPAIVVVVAPGTVVVDDMGMVSPGIVVDGITPPVTNESSVYFEGRHAPGDSGEVPRATAIDATST